MPMIDLFSKRQKRIRNEEPEVFQYTDLPEAFRVQVVHILEDAIGSAESSDSTSWDLFTAMHQALCREYGLFSLAPEAQRKRGDRDTVYAFFLECPDVERALDVVELAFRNVDVVTRSPSYRRQATPRLDPDEAISELNQRFMEHCIGYQFESGELLRIDSTLVHSEIVKPALAVLSSKTYTGANDEYLRAHEHYRHGRYKECLSDCLKSFESTMKAICAKRKWPIDGSATARSLLNTCFQNNLIPSYLQSHFSAMRSSLECGIPSVRNKLAGHGQGTEPTTVPRYLAAYLLHLTATSILFLADAEKELA